MNTDHLENDYNRNWVKLVHLNMLEPGKSIVVEVKEQAVLICYAIDGIYAIANQCTHTAKPLQGGCIRGHYLFCPVHGARFDLKTGIASGITKNPIKTYNVRIEQDYIFVCI